MTVHAEWKFHTITDPYDIYIDFSRIKTEGRYKSMWELNDEKSPQTDSSGKQYKSSVTKSVFDCQASRRQLVALYLYSGQMGMGEVVYSGSYQIQESDWKYPPPNSIGEGSINIACGKK
jgi:hypothetical protein